MIVMILTIIVTYNGEKYIEDCLDSLLAQTHSIDILIVDNASSDNTCSIVQNKYPTVKIINIGYNSGFAHANNVGIQYAIDRGYKYVMLINEDTISDNMLVENLLKYADEQTAVTPKIYMNGSQTKLWYAAGKIDFKTCEAVNCQKELADQVVEVSFMTGCCMFLHTEILRKIGLFDENFFMYYEDTDLSLRMYENNIKMIFNPDAHLWHRLQGKTTKGYYVYYMERNKLFFLNKHKKLFDCNILKFILCSIKKTIIKPNIYIIAFNKYKVKGIIDFIKNKTGMMESR